jgi:hypothetical protein
VRVLKPFRILAQRKYGQHVEFGGAVDSVTDVPQSLLKKVSPYVQVVKPGTALKPIAASLDTAFIE